MRLMVPGHRLIIITNQDNFSRIKHHKLAEDSINKVSKDLSPPLEGIVKEETADEDSNVITIKMVDAIIMLIQVNLIGSNISAGTVVNVKEEIAGFHTPQMKITVMLQKICKEICYKEGNKIIGFQETDFKDNLKDNQEMFKPIPIMSNIYPNKIQY